MLERPGEEHVRSGHGLQLVAIVAEADDHGPGIDALERLEQEVHPFVPDQLAEVENRRRFLREEDLQPLGIAVVGKPLVRVARVRLVAHGLLEQLPERLGPRLRPERLDVDAGRNLVDPIDVADDGLEHLPDVRRADEDSSGVGERLASPAGELLVAAHRVLELGAVGLDGEGQAARGSHRPSEEHVIGEDQVGGCELAQDGGVGLDETVSLFLRGVLEELRLHPLVPVEDEHGQEAADVGSHRLHAAEVVELRVRLLRHDHDVVTGPAPLTRDRPRVDVGAGAAE